MSEFTVWNLKDDPYKYNHYIERCFNRTPYHLAEYLLAEEEAEEEKNIRIFLLEENDDFALFPAVIRRVNSLSYMCDLKEEVYDLITPHEYGGIISSRDLPMLQKLLLEHIFDYGKRNHVIFQFVRINPYLKDLPDLYKNAGYEIIHSCSQVFVDLRKKEEEIIKDYKYNVRWSIKRAKREGLKFEIAMKNSENVRTFQNIYNKAMDRLNAERFFYFNDEYFHGLMKCDCTRLCFVRDVDDTVIASSILLLEENTVYYHLSCLDRSYASKQPMNYLLHCMILWSKKMGYTTFHLGGGGKSLLQFKEGYSKDRVDYYTAYMISDRDRYQNICEIWKNKFPQYADKQFYPLYRYRE